MSVWDDAGWNLAPAAEAIGPFTTRDFLRAVHPAGDVELVSAGDAAIAVTRHADGTIRMAGEADLTDYHSPLGGDVKPVIAELIERWGGTPGFIFDSLPEAPALALCSAMEAAGLQVAMERHAVTAVVTLVPSYEDYLDAIGKKQRHEVRRKRRRYEDEVGEVVHETHRQVDWAFDEFMRLHRLSSGPKGDFMNQAHESVFRCLAATPGWRLDMLRVPGEDRAAACLFSYAQDDGLYLYNSAYDPGLSHASPGIVMISTMLEVAIAEGLPRFDFLKGDEEYKFRLGAEPRPLYRIEAKT